jgi:hypothetical protein
LVSKAFTPYSIPDNSCVNARAIHNPAKHSRNATPSPCDKNRQTISFRRAPRAKRKPTSRRRTLTK